MHFSPCGRSLQAFDRLPDLLDDRDCVPGQGSRSDRRSRLGLEAVAGGGGGASRRVPARKPQARTGCRGAPRRNRTPHWIQTCNAGVERMTMTLTELREAAAALGHVELRVVANASGQRFFVECDCGYKSTTRTSQRLAIEAARHHIATEVAKVGRDGVTGVSARHITR